MSGHPLTDVGNQGTNRELAASHCWADKPLQNGTYVDCSHLTVDVLGLCEIHRAEIIGQ